MDHFSIWHWVVALLALLVYFMPTFIAHRRAHPRKIPILLVNLFLGWTGIGWIAALIWALRSYGGSGRLIWTSPAQ
jgi:hypothetical protein